MAKEVQTEVKLNHRQCLLTVIPEADMAERPTKLPGTEKFNTQCWKRRMVSKLSKQSIIFSYQMSAFDYDREEGRIQRYAQDRDMQNGC